MKNWKIKPKISSTKIDELSTNINTPPHISSILLRRGVNDFNEAKAFFRPQLKDLHDPLLMQDLEKAAIKINDYILGQKKILIYGDYDVDGSTSVSLMISFLSKYHKNLEYYIPDRYLEGYGVSLKGIDYAHSQGIDLIIALDCGVTAIDQVDYANEKGIDFIICDHHQPGKELPKAYAILNPKRSDCSYPYKELSGCGVGYKLLQGLCQLFSEQYDERFLQEHLDLLAISIACDIVDIQGENRILSYYGVNQIRTAPRPSIHSMLRKAGINHKEVRISNLVFGIGPKINAAGRIAHAHNAVKLLISQDQEEIDALFNQIDEWNETRKTYEKDVVEEALLKIESDIDHENEVVTVVAGDDWHKGVIGIAASRLIEKYYRPTVVFTQTSEETMAASVRSIEGIDVYTALHDCKEYIIQFGGHTMAAGLSILTSNLTSFRKAFNQAVLKQLNNEDIVEELWIDEQLEIKDILSVKDVMLNKHPKFYNILTQLEPFGPGNMAPVFCIKNAQLKTAPKILKDEHLKFTFVNPEDNCTVDGIFFRCEDYFNLVEHQKALDIAFTIETNDWNQQRRIQFMIKDVKVCEE